MESQHLTNDNVLTFMDIISHHKIEIPVIQRDYAQGRKSSRINPIRKKFIKDLIDALKDFSKSIHLDFVYGRVGGKNQKLVFAKNKEAIENILLAVKGYADQCNIDFDPKIKVPDTINDSINSNFIPLDGQQRLTTLYLLHWYILKRIEVDDKEVTLSQLKGFSYKTRNSTKEFCTFLITTGTFLNFEKDKSITKSIEESPLFYSIWKKDPSVQGMLTTLEEIHDLLKSVDDNSLIIYWTNLTKNRNITFDFLDLDDYEQTDELYVKMNARGKQLTDFEHFKSWLHEYTKSNGIKISESKWSDKIDTKWLDLFWKNKPENTFEVDALIYNFIKSINLYEYITRTPKEPKNKEQQSGIVINKELIEKIRESNEDKGFISVAEFEDSKFFSSESLDFTFSCLTKLYDIDLGQLHDNLKNITLFPFLGNANKEAKLPFIFLSDNFNPSLPDRVFYYAFLIFISDNSIDLSEIETTEQLKQWMRICRNIIYNTYIQNPDNFIDAVKAINELSVHKCEIEKAISTENFSIKFFDSQLKEEIKKIEYFDKSDKWKMKIIEIENHTYFYGQIDFIFNLLDNQNDYLQFEFYCDKLSKIFNQLEANNFLFHRLLLSKGIYLVNSNSKYSFCESNAGSLRVRQDNWRKVFNDETKLKYLKAVLDETTSLDISDSSLVNYSKQTWESFFIDKKYIQNISYLQNRLIDWQNVWDIKLLEKLTLIGKHGDLYSYSLYLDLKIEKSHIKYISVNGRRSESNKPKIEIELNNETVILFYEPNFNSENCAFVIEFGSTKFDDNSEFIKMDKMMVYSMNKSRVAEEYGKALIAISKLLKSILE
ncbi:DUF262 domain-containing protein [Aquiflexum balticum]|nr:DUF262 domain-containing protein [Aquiflexum balticum]